MIVWLLLAVPVLWVVAYRYRRRRMYALASKIPAGAYERPLTGLAHKFIGSTEDIMSSLKDVSYSSIENNGMSRMWLGHILYLICTDPVDIEAVLKNCLEKDDLHRFMRKFIGYGGIFAPVSIWRPRRKISVRAFTPKVVESFLPIFAKQSMKLTSKVGEQAGGDRFCLWPFISSYTLDSVCETALGVRINAQEENNAPFLVALNKGLELACKRIFHLWLQPDWLYKFFPDYIRSENCLEYVHGFTNDVIRKKRVQLKTELLKSPEADREFEFLKTNETFLELLIRLSGGEKGYSDQELREEILTLTIAATDTSATAVGYVIKLLAKYPDVQDKVIQELDEVFGDSDRLFEKEDLARLNYQERVIKETLRLFPPVPFIIRKVEEETVLLVENGRATLYWDQSIITDGTIVANKPDIVLVDRSKREALLVDITIPHDENLVKAEDKLTSGRVLPAGSGVGISIWGTHRNPKYWGPDAEKFDPDRFLPERFNLKHPCAFMPFSNGPRNCIGYQYAMMSIKTALSSMLRYYRVVSDPETKSSPQIRVKLDIMMKAVDGYEIALQRRRPLVRI